MSLYKRNKTWWTDFSVHGQRYRESLDTTDWREAQHKEKELIAQASQGKLTPSGQSFARLAFGEAAVRYLAERAPHLAPISVRTEKERLKPLTAYFGGTPLSTLSTDAILAYIAHRKESGISNRTVNMEIRLLSRILKRAKRWHLVAEDIKPLPERRNIGRALSYDEKVRLERTAASKPEWQVARLAMKLALNTTMRGCEIKGLRWRDVNFIDQTLTVQRSKTEAGERTIPLNAEAMGAILELRERGKTFGGPEPEHFVFPTCEGYTRPDPTKPMSNWRSAWRSLTRAAGLRGLRFHDLRHHAITELAESNASEQTIMAIAGHVSPRMLAHYSHVRLEAKRRALDALSKKPHDLSSEGSPEGGYVTKNVTNEVATEVPDLQAIENAGGDDGTRTRDLMRDRHAF